MALITCRECGHSVSDQAAACPKCGAPIATSAKPAEKKPSGCGTIVVLVVLLFVVLAAIRSCDSTSSSTAIAPVAGAPPAKPAPPSDEQRKAWVDSLDNKELPASQRLDNAKELIRNFPGTEYAHLAQTKLNPLEMAASEEADRGAWRYTSTEDAMSGKQIRSAAVLSENAFEFEFPYAGEQHATLEVRRHPRYGNDIIVSIERGQILCSSYECPVRIRFDDGAPITVTGTEPADNSSEYVFIPGYNGLSARIAKARTMRIEVNVFHQGALMAEFKVKGFEPEKLK